MNRFRIDLLILLIVFGAPVLQWIIAKLREQAEEARKKREYESRRTEALRTGQALPQRVDPREEAKARQAAVAAARQQKLRELRERAIAEAEARRRQAATRTGSAGTPTARAPTGAPSPVRRAPTPIRSAPVPAGRAGQANAERMNAARQRQIDELRRRQREHAKRTQTKPSIAPTPPAEERYQSVFAAQARSVPTDKPAPDVSRPRRQLGKLSANDARRGIILAELLAPPLALRTQDPLCPR